MTQTKSEFTTRAVVGGRVDCDAANNVPKDRKPTKGDVN